MEQRSRVSLSNSGRFKFSSLQRKSLGFRKLQISVISCLSFRLNLAELALFIVTFMQRDESADSNATSPANTFIPPQRKSLTSPLTVRDTVASMSLPAFKICLTGCWLLRSPRFRQWAKYRGNLHLSVEREQPEFRLSICVNESKVFRVLCK